MLILRPSIVKILFLSLSGLTFDVTTPEHWGLTEWPSSIYKDPDSPVFVDMSINVKLPANIAKQVLDLINDYGIEK